MDAPGLILDEPQNVPEIFSYLQQILDEMVMVAEGVKTTESVHGLTQKVKVEMPIANEVYKTLFEDKPSVEAMQDLMTRASKIEDWS